MHFNFNPTIMLIRLFDHCLIISTIILRCYAKIEAIPPKSDDIEDCFRMVKTQKFWTAVSIRSKPYKDYKVSKTLNTLKMPTYTMDLSLNENDWLLFSKNSGKENIYFIYTKYDEFLNIQNPYIWRYRPRLILFMKDSELSMDSISELFLRVYKNSDQRIVNMVIASVSEMDNKIQAIYIRNPFLGRIEMRKRCRNIFPNFFNNLYGSQFNVTMKASLLAIKDGYQFEGLEGKMAATIIKAMNGTAQYQRESDGLGIGYDEPPFYGTLQDIVTGKSLFTFNGRFLSYQIHKNKVNMLLEYTYPRYKDGIVIYMPVPPSTYIPSKLLKLQHFPSIMPVAAVICSVFFIIVVKVSSGGSPSETIFVALAVFAAQSGPISLLRKNKLPFAGLTIFGLIFITIFTSRLPRSFSVPIRPQVAQTLQDMADKTFPINLHPRYVRLMQYVLDPDIFAKLKSRLNTSVDMREYVEESQLDYINSCNDQGYVLKSSTVAFLRKKNYWQERTICHVLLREGIMPSWSTYMANYGSPYLPQVNYLLSKIYESGLDKVFAKNRFSAYPDNIRNHFYRASFYQLPLSVLHSVFVVFGWSSFVSFIVFLLEIVYFNRFHILFPKLITIDTTRLDQT